MSDISAQINLLLQDQTIRQALTASAYETVSKTMAEAKTLADKLAAAELSLKDAKKTIEGQSAEIAAMGQRLKAANDDLAKYRAREEQFLRNEIKAEFNQLRINDHINMVGLIFRNTEVRKVVSGTIPVPVEGSGSGLGFVSEGRINTTNSETLE